MTTDSTLRLADRLATLRCARTERNASLGEITTLTEAEERIRALEGERERMRGALEWYADPRWWQRTTEQEFLESDPEAVQDGGQRARAALAAAGKGGS